MNHQTEIEKIKHQNHLLKSLGTAIGFYKFFFDNLPNHKTYIECFNYVNDLHFDLFGEYRYSCFDSFKQNRLYKNKK